MASKYDNMHDASNKTAKRAGNLIKFGAKTAGKIGTKLASTGFKVLFHFIKNGAVVSGKLVAAGPVGWIVLAILLVIFLVCLILVLFTLNIYIDEATKNDGINLAYISYDNIGDFEQEGSYNADETKLSAANTAALAYYTLLKDKTVVQLYENEDGSFEYISMNDRRAKKDKFQRDKKMEIDYNILYSMNQSLFGANYVFPESFLNPVPYDDDFKLKTLLDDNGKLRSDIVSQKRDNKGNVIGEENSIADFGISSVCTYKEVETGSYLKGTYTRVCYVNTDTGEETFEDLDKPIAFEYQLGSQKVDVLDKSVSMWASRSYDYIISTGLSSTCAQGQKSSNPKDNVEMILQDEETASSLLEGEVEYRAYNKYTSSAPVYTFKTIKELEDFLATHPAYTTSYTDGKPTEYHVGGKEGNYEVYYCRDEKSGVYTTSVAPGTVEEEVYDNTYLYQYLNCFSTYKPKISRDYGQLRRLTSKASLSSYSSAANDGVGGSSNGAPIGDADLEAYIERLGEAAKEDVKTSGILASFTVAQALLEGGTHPISKLAREYNNCFGMKATSDWKNRGGKVVEMNTREVDANGNEYWVVAEFCWFDSIEEGLAWHSRLFWKYDRYKGLRGETDFDTAAHYISTSGYATENPDVYYKAMRSRYDTYDLGRFDTETWCGTPPPYAESDEFVGGGGAGNEDQTVTTAMNEEDQEIFSNFYHAMDDCYNGENSVDSFYASFGEDEVDNVLRAANRFTYGLTIDEEIAEYDHDDLLSMSLLASERGETSNNSESDDSEYAPGDDIVALALGEVGTTEYGPNTCKYTEYFGMNGSEWCDIFVCWCADQLGYLRKYIPCEFACRNTATAYEAQGLYHERGSGYVPKPGDLIIFNTTRGPRNHIGIVTSVSGSDSGTMVINTVEGNAGNPCVSVITASYPEDKQLSTGGYRINGYCEVPYGSEMIIN